MSLQGGFFTENITPSDTDELTSATKEIVSNTGDGLIAYVDQASGETVYLYVLQGARYAVQTKKILETGTDAGITQIWGNMSGIKH